MNDELVNALQADLPPGVRVAELRALLRNANGRDIAWTSLVRRFGEGGASVVLAALHARDLLAPEPTEGRYAQTPAAHAWIERTMRREFEAENVRAALRGLVQRARQLRERPGAVLLPQRIVACSELPSAEAERAKQVEVHVVLVPNEAALAAAREAAFRAITSSIRSRRDEDAWLAARRRATAAFLGGGTPMLRVTAGEHEDERGGVEIFPGDGSTPFGAWHEASAVTGESLRSR